MKKINWFLIITVFTSILTTILTIFLINQSENIRVILVEFMLILTSSVLSAIIAYYIAKYQIDKKTAIDTGQIKQKNLNNLEVLLLEMKDNNEILSYLQDSEITDSELSIINLQISQKIWDSTYSIIEVSPALLKELYLANKKLLLLNPKIANELKSEVTGFIKGYKDATENLEKYISQNK